MAWLLLSEPPEVLMESRRPDFFQRCASEKKLDGPDPRHVDKIQYPDDLGTKQQGGMETNLPA